MRIWNQEHNLPPRSDPSHQERQAWMPFPTAEARIAKITIELRLVDLDSPTLIIIVKFNFH